MTLGEIWKSNTRLLLSYVTESRGDVYILWTVVQQHWGNVKNVKELESFINRSECSAKLKSNDQFRVMPLRAVMAEITLDSSMITIDAALYYFGRGSESLRELAVQTGPLVTMWYKNKHFKTANIVAVDFIDTTGIIEVAIWSNIYRAKCGNNENYSINKFHAAQIIIFYSPLNSELIKGQIVIYWHMPNFIEGDTLNLYYGHPELNQIMPIYFHKPKDKSGVVKTGIPPRHAFYDMDSSFVEQCIGYYGAWIRNGTIQKLNCLSTYPDWMSKQKERLRYMTIGNIFIPGTHNSGSYSEEIPQTFFDRYSVTQDTTILDQLISGARYLDLRPCKYYSDYWICHSLYYMQPFEIVIRDVKEFMDNTNEIVILSFKEFPKEFSSDDHNNFAKYLLVDLNDHIAPLPLGLSRHMTLGQMWDSQRRLIISYDYDITLIPAIRDNFLFWDPIIQEWGNVNSPEKLQKFIDDCENYSKYAAELWIDDPPQFRAMMAAVTLDVTSILTDSVAHIFGRGSNSLREIGTQVGTLLTVWYNENNYTSANIVAVDFIDATGIVPVAIYWNKIRGDQNYAKIINRSNI
ncbi:uncharacterized protein LOC141535666 isoform X2 [Cotesia typhae]